MKRLSAVLLAVPALALVPSAAHAGTPSLLVTDAPYVNGGCTNPAYAYDAQPPAGFTDVTVYLYAHSSSYGTTADVTRDGAVGSGTFNLCNAAAGAYVVDMSVFACTASVSSCTRYEGPTATFYVGDRPTIPPAVHYLQASLKAGVRATKPEQRVVFKVKATYGLASMGAADAFLQQKVGGRWTKVRGTESPLTGAGRAKWTLVVPGSRLQVRARVSMFDETVFTTPVTLT